MSVNHSGEAGQRPQKEPGSKEPLNNANSNENHFYPSASNINGRPSDDVKTRQIFQINVPMDC